MRQVVWALACGRRGLLRRWSFLLYSSQGPGLSHIHGEAVGWHVQDKIDLWTGSLQLFILKNSFCGNDYGFHDHAWERMQLKTLSTRMCIFFLFQKVLWSSNPEDILGNLIPLILIGSKVDLHLNLAQGCRYWVDDQDENGRIIMN